jgi:hypothetical protein
MKATGLKEVDLRILIDCISNEIFNLVIVKNKKVKFGCLGTFVAEYYKRQIKSKRPERKVNKKKIVLNNASVLTKTINEVLEKEKKNYENRIIW